ncbi:MAG: YggS family pyridoxal phosphate-dependent enzyme [Dysgonamonadaceae bacterium]|jgi:pyridoxal phosphate enzyme (YggS family)|nr:YggS family pyridoxal phosphate-dependent enzyme [Dysgonamonadaceae bacterium]
MTSIESRIRSLGDELPPNVRLVAVSKFHPASRIREAYDTGQRVFGENRVQELVEKQPQLPPDAEWHFIGSLQRNKVKLIVPFIACIHSLDSERLMLEIERQAAEINRVVPCLLELHVAQEESKSGFLPDECRKFLAEGRWRDCPHIRISGIMGMATFTDDETQIRKEFRLLKSLFEEFKADYFAESPSFKEISMGMSDDYPIAVEEGSTMLRIGSLIFGARGRGILKMEG